MASQLNDPSDREAFRYLVTGFVQELEESLQVFTGEKIVLETLAVGSRLSIRLPQIDDAPDQVPLRVEDGSVLLGLRLKFDCTLDSGNSHIAIDNSSFEVMPLARHRGDPLFRIEFVRDQTSEYPSSHFHIHAHRDEFTHLLGYAGRGSRAARKRGSQRVCNPPHISEFHFPTGGPRFRPCLEDILEVLRVEFGLKVDTEKWKPHLRSAREKWRRIQTAAVVRDCPEVAINTLKENFGISIPLSATEFKPNLKKLQQS